MEQDDVKLQGPVKLQEIEVNFFWVDFKNMKTWKEHFNQVSFFNHDTSAPVYINDHPIQPAVGQVPGVFVIQLNQGEVNETVFRIDPKQSASPSLEIVYVQYKNVPQQWL